MDQGVIVGADRKAEWLLPWWWNYYSLHNQFPVTFFDFGMTKKARLWCLERGSVARCTFPPLKDLSLEMSSLFSSYQKKQKNLWTWRQGVFKKPYAMGASPYTISLWIDLDCEVCAPIDPLFQILEDGTDLAIASYPCPCHEYAQRIQIENVQDPKICYNSGVVVFRHKAPIICAWQKLCQNANDCFLTDDWALSHLIRSQNIPITELPRIWNWCLLKFGANPFACINHFDTSLGKQFIRKYKGVQEFLPQRKK
jgi:hypothetical protein